MLLFLPMIGLAFVLLDSSAHQLDQHAVTKFIILVMGYALYFLIFVFVSVTISGFARSSGLSLLTLLGIWIISCIVLPKATSNLADKIYPSPSLFEFKEQVSHKVKNGIDGHNPSDARLASLKQEVLDQYGVTTIEELPVNWSGIAMQAGEEYTDNVYDQEFSNVETTLINQNEVSEWASFITPFLAIRNLSMALSGTDFNSHLTFTKAAEHYRRAFVKKMNKDMELNHKPGVAYGDYKLDSEMWASIEPFNYQLPKVGSILAQQWRSIAALGSWLVALLLVSSYTTRKIPLL
jgi:ABC-2 type transport system permease protein